MSKLFIGFFIFILTVSFVVAADSEIGLDFFVEGDDAAPVAAPPGPPLDEDIVNGSDFTNVDPVGYVDPVVANDSVNNSELDSSFLESYGNLLFAIGIILVLFAIVFLAWKSKIFFGKKR